MRLRRPEILLLATLTGAILVLLALARDEQGREAEVVQPAPGGALGPGAPETTDSPSESEARPAGERVLDPAQPVSRRGASARDLVCRAAEDGRPLAGVALYEGQERVAGPSGDDGRISLPETSQPLLTVWKSGRGPQTLRTRNPPGEVRLVLTRSSLEVRLLNVPAEHRVLRCQLQADAQRSAARGPWSPTLQRRALDLYAADDLLPGRYDVYFWIGAPGDSPTACAVRGVELEEGQRRRVSLDPTLHALAEPED